MSGGPTTGQHGEQRPGLRLLVTGAGGQLGSDVTEAATRRHHLVLGLGHAELDITDAARTSEVIGQWAPDAIIHCAAWTAVDDAEAAPEQAFAVNEAGTRNVAEAARAVGAYLITVSTDYVFDGSNAEGYAELDATAPINIYGASKLAAELATLEVPGAAIARTAWLFGRSGNNFVRTIARLAAERDSIDVVTDQVGSPTYSGHLVEALVSCAEQRLPGVLHLAGSPIATWFDVAKEVVAALGTACEVRPTTSDSFVRPAPRPACSVLRVTRSDTPAVGDWRAGVQEVVGALQPAG